MLKILEKYIVCFLVLLGICLTFIEATAQDKISKNWLDWSSLPSLPDSLGIGGAFIGESNGVLIVAGGSNFLQPTWEGGEKQFHRQIFVLEKSGENFNWQRAGQLPFAVSNGASVSTLDGVLCMGGVNETGSLDKVFLLRWNPVDREIEIEENFPALPQGCSYLSAAIASNRVYVAGGKSDDEEGKGGLKNFWSLDLSVDNNSAKEWNLMPTWPGAARYGSVLVAQSNGEHQCIYLFSGKNGAKTYLKDTWQYNPFEEEVDKRWTQKADLPHATMAASATTFGQSHILMFSGSDGHDIDRIPELKENYQFVKDVLAYHTITDTWIRVGEMPQGLVTSQVVQWDGRWVIPTGEIAPSIRTSKVYSFTTGAIASKSPFHWVDYITLGLYLILITGLGVYFSKGNSDSTNNYFLGGGKIPFWAAGISIMATSISSVGFMATPSKSFATNWAYFAGTLTLLVVIPIVVWAFIPFYHRLKVVSAYEYLEARFNVAARLFAAISYCIFQVAGRMAIVLYLPGIALAAVTGMDVYLAILLMGVLSTTYTVMGGMEAVIWTDVIQGFVLIGGALLCIAMAIFGVDGGPGHFFEVAWSSQKFSFGDIDWDYATASMWVVVVGNIFYRLSTFSSDQSIVQRYMSTSDEKQAKRASWTSMLTLIPWSIIVFGLGTALFVFYKEHPAALNPTVDTDGIVPLFIAQNVPIGVSGLIIAGIFAAAMSSLDSAMHSTATVVVTDFYHRFFPGTTEAARLKLAKWLIGIFGLLGTGISLLMVTQNIISIWDVFIAFTGLFGGITAGLFLLGIFTTKAHGTGAMVGVIGSTILLYFVKANTDIHVLLYGAIGMISCVLLGYLASWVIPGKASTIGLTIYSKNLKNIEKDTKVNVV